MRSAVHLVNESFTTPSFYARYFFYDFCKIWRQFTIGGIPNTLFIFIAFHVHSFCEIIGNIDWFVVFQFKIVCMFGKIYFYNK